jgi:DNA polymerase III subunit epsilon
MLPPRNSGRQRTGVRPRRLFKRGRNAPDGYFDHTGVDRSHRAQHGALLDAELLTAVCVELTCDRQAALQLAPTTWAPSIVPTVAHVQPSPLPSRVTADDQAAHQAFVATLGGEAVWSDYGVARLVNRVEIELRPFFVD